MSSGKTAALGLNQWVLSDQFLMEEFNEDNRRVDAGFASLATVKLGEIVTTQACQQIDLDVSGIEWAKYYKVVIYWRLVHNSTATSPYSLGAVVTANNCSEKRYFSSSTAIKDYPDSNTVLFQEGMDDLTRQNFPRYKMELFTDDGCVFTNRGSSIFAGNLYHAAAFQTSVSDRTPAPVSTLLNLNFKLINNPNFVSMLPGSKFEIYGVRK